MDIKAKIMELVEKIQSDKALQAKFKENPVEAVESLLNVGFFQISSLLF